ncbi:MAG: ABC transporter permease [Clostridia bacterium]|nr:ABC transporter permease [Clostridia bacterium]
MFKLLLKTRFQMFFASMTQGKKGKNRTTGGKIGMTILFAFLGLYVTFAMAALFISMNLALAGTENEFFPLALALLITLTLTLFGSIFPTKTQIFDSKDNELLISMPIPPKYIFISRLVFLLIINYLLESIVLVPAIICFAIFTGFTLMGFIFTLLVFILVPFLTLSVSSLLAWLISLIASKIKNKTFVTVFLFAIFFGAYMFGAGMIGSFSESDIVTVDLSGFKNAPVIGWGARAMTYGEAVPFLLFLLCCIAPAILAYLLLNRSFIKILTTKKGSVRVKYKEKNEKVSGMFMTLVKKEMKRFATSSAYILNEGMGILMVIIFTIMICVTVVPIKQDIIDTGMDFILPLIGFGVVAFGSSMIMISAPSISLEDKNLWILQSLPVHPHSVLLAKVCCHIIISLPACIVSCIILGVALGLSVLDTAAIIIATSALVVFGAYFGMFLGLCFPKFDWQNENVALKQGFAIFGAMFGGMIWCSLMVGVALLMSFISFALGALIVTLINGAACFGIHTYFHRGGERRFALLKQ